MKFKTTKEIKVPSKTTDQVIGQDHAINIIKKAAKQKRNVLLIGEPGVGKSLVGQALSELLPTEDLLDVVAFPNPTDENVPLVKTFTKGKGKEILARAKIQAASSFRTQNWVILILILIVNLVPYYFWKKGAISDVIYAASIISSIVFIVGFILFFNLGKRMKIGQENPIPKLLIDNSDRKCPPFIDACLLPGQKIFTNPMPVKIEETAGMHVFNAEGKKQKVINVERIPWQGKVYHIKPRLLFPFTATQNHPFLIFERPKIKEFKLREFKKISKNLEKHLKWKKAEELTTNDLLIYPELNHQETYSSLLFDDPQKKIPNKVIFDKEIAEIFGWYLAEGYVRCAQEQNKYCVGFALGKHEVKEVNRLKYLIKKRFNLNSSIDTHSKKSIELLIYSKTLTLKLRGLFDSGAKNKRLPKTIFESPKEVKLAFLNSYIKGDGHENNKMTGVATTSKELAEDLIFLFASLGIFPTCSHRKMMDSKIGNRKIKGPEIYEFNITGKQQRKLGKNKGKFQHYFTKDNLNFIPIRKIWAEDYKGDIINMETEDGTYLMPCITHNTGSHTGSLLGDVLHDPLQSLKSSDIISVIDVGNNQIQLKKEPMKVIDNILKKHKKELIKKDTYEATFLDKNEMFLLTEKDGKIEPVEVLSVNRYTNKRDLIKLTTESGKELIVTPEHKVATKTTLGKIKYLRADKIKPWHKLITLDF